MKAGYHKYLTEEDLWALPVREALACAPPSVAPLTPSPSSQPDDTAEALGHRLEEAWNKRKKALPKQKEVKEGEKAPRPSLTGALTAAYGGPFFTAAVFKLLQDCLAFAQPQLLKRLLQFVATYRTETPEPAFHGYILALGMFVTAITQTVRSGMPPRLPWGIADPVRCRQLLLHCYFSRVFETGMRVRAGLVNLIYKKSLVLSNDERGGRLTGDIVNLQSTDATRLQVSFGLGLERHRYAVDASGTQAGSL